jgi:uncharacterized membrane-anchored protein
MMRKTAGIGFVTLLALAASAAAQDSVSADSLAARRARFAASLKYQTGDVTLKGGIATLRGVGQAYRFLDGEQAGKVLRAWGNPVKENPLGMLVPAGMTPVDSGAWAIIITYQDDGYVSDSGASTINYDSLLAQLQTSARDENPERKKQGYPTFEVVGWALPPRYDAQTKKLYWAEELSFDGDTLHTLNYKIRVLGRRGVLVLNAVSAMSQLPLVQEATPAALAMVEFNPGNRYADFIKGKDHMAAYGIGALIIGGIAAKAGFFKLLIPLLLAAKKLVIVAVAAVAAFFRRLVGGKKKTPAAS